MSTVIYRPGTAGDAPSLARMLQALTAAGKRTRPSDLVFARDHYLTSPNLVVSTVAVDETDQVIGLQVVSRVTGENPWGTEIGWGMIGTHVHPDAARQGLGRGLFARTRPAIEASDLPAVDASIGDTNEVALAYYGAMGFVTYRTAPGLVCKALYLR